MTHHLAVCWRGALHAPVAAGVSGTDARVTARRPWTATSHSSSSSSPHPSQAPPSSHVDQVTVIDGPVGRRPDRLAVEFHLLLGVSELQGAGTLVRWGFLAIRQRDCGRQVDLVLQVRVGGLEAAEAVALHKGGSSEAIPRLWSVQHLRDKQKGGDKMKNTSVQTLNQSIPLEQLYQLYC